MVTDFRNRRLQAHLLPVLRGLARETHPIRILDIGGSASYWLSVEPELRALNCRIALLNLSEKDAMIGPNASGIFSFITGDARKIPCEDNAFDLVHSNSVIEHVGTWRDMAAMAAEVRRLAKSYYVQVPYFWFPYETHYEALFVHWLPPQLQARLFMRFKFGGTPRATVGGAMEKAQYTNLLDRFQFQALFPDAAIVSERFCGLTKSLIALRRGPAA